MWVVRKEKLYYSWGPKDIVAQAIPRIPKPVKDSATSYKQSQLATPRFSKEILLLIFEFANSHDDWTTKHDVRFQRTPWILSAVCKRWRQVARSEPTLWNNIWLSLESGQPRVSVDMHTSRVMSLLVRSSPFKLQITGLGAFFAFSTLPIGLLNGWNFNNLETLVLCGSWDPTSFSDWKCDVHLPRLDRCVIAGKSVPIGLSIAFFDGCIALRKLELINVFVLRNVWKDQYVDTVIELLWTDTMVMDISSFAMTLQCFPMVESLELFNIKPVNRPAKSWVNHKVPLGNLQTFVASHIDGGMLVVFDCQTSRELRYTKFRNAQMITPQFLGSATWVLHDLDLGLIQGVSFVSYFASMNKLRHLRLYVTDKLQNTTVRNLLNALSYIYASGDILLPRLRSLEFSGNGSVSDQDLLTFVHARRTWEKMLGYSVNEGFGRIHLNRMEMSTFVQSQFKGLSVQVFRYDATLFT